MSQYSLTTLIATASLVLSGSAVAASFDCTRAASPRERLVCDDSALSDLDSRLGQLYAERRAALSTDGAALLQESERSWLHYVATMCPLFGSEAAPARDPAECLKNQYTERLGQLAEVAMHMGPYLFSRIDLYGAEAAPERDFGSRPGFYIQHTAYPRIDAPLTPQAQAWNKRVERKLSTGDDCGQGDDDTDYKIGYANGSVISIQWFSSTYCHSTPHGMYFVKSDNTVLTPTLRELTEGDIFCAAPQCSNRLKTLFASTLSASGWSPRSDDAEDIRQDVEEYMMQPKNWHFTREGLAVEFPEGLGGCYACNPPSVTVPWVELRPLMTPGSLLR